MCVSSDPLALFCHKALRDTFLSVTTYETKLSLFLNAIFRIDLWSALPLIDLKNQQRAIRHDRPAGIRTESV